MQNEPSCPELAIEIFPIMQSKISTFFKRPSSISSHRSPEPLNSNADDSDYGTLKIWEKAEHQYINTYKRRNVTSPQCVDLETKIPIPDDSSAKSELASSTKILVKNKKRSYAQYHLLFGQSDFLLHFCSTCGIKYARGDEDDEQSHKAFHKKYTCGIQFKGWTHERVIDIPSVEGGRILLVLDSDPSAHKHKVEEVVKMMEKELGSGWILHKNYQVYLFVSSQRIVGCLVVEPITKAYKVVSCFLDERTEVSKIKDSKPNSTTLQFGNITFQREAILKKPTNNPEALEMNMNGAILCEEEPVPAVCGIRAIWVTPANRRKHIASRLLDAARKSFYKRAALECSQLAFSQPTSSGMALASKYVSSKSILVYKSSILI
ncbi:protein CHROMOSOME TRANSMISSION FIDELITY 7 isoform X1 [Benincasa hispida]|uniref:protein CHROMOSOME TRANSMISSION FIDELITY 7 isoform X1 n=1 Tax=Benincasa hispida TaxID=102211 RepID=UPI0019016FDB|nr:protein CHROMOSOME TRANSMISSION FIDELITY 7 isoform X1 [Benincasa hispida]XP_038904838.1 protein CHROMOSOME TRANSMISSION FIDELITY 7 isoform X1 [Benincasa hispida]XP_038904839.1 protein CHROMOSOME TRANSMISSION FIDELITY 7 isoform X1 [Benincasa hispida]